MNKKTGRINDKKQVLKTLDNLLKSVGQQYSIKVGIIGEKAKQIHKGTNLTNADLGAVHEFGATIKLPERDISVYRSINADGDFNYDGRFRKKNAKSTNWQEDYHLGETEIVIPARSFLREVLYNKEVQKHILDAANLSNDNELNAAYIEYKLMTGDTQIMERIAGIIGAKALEFVQTAFYTGGYPNKWKPITEQSKKHRTGDPSNPPLQDTGDLMDSIDFEVKKTG